MEQRREVAQKPSPRRAPDGALRPVCDPDPGNVAAERGDFKGRDSSGLTAFTIRVDARQSHVSQPQLLAPARSMLHPASEPQVCLKTSRGTQMEITPVPFKPDLNVKPEVVPFFDPETNTISYIVKDRDSPACAVVDSVMDFDYASGRISYEHADAMIAHIEGQRWRLEWLIETHVHADHLSAAPYIQQRLGGRLGIGENIRIVQDMFGKVFNEGTEFRRDGSQFDRLFKDGDSYQLGTLTAFVMHTPGHTPACTTHVIGDAAFVGDTLFMPDGGSARADFPGGDAATLYRSMRRILTLPDEMRLFMCHDYGPNGREIRWESTVGEERRHNIHVHDGVTEAEFVAMREARDKTLGMPRLIIPSLQVNMRAGQLPPEDESGKTFLKVPINGL
jgi:glyoxylase-like metal-dependent hydrolase (beta-lactamase superfamily II)